MICDYDADGKGSIGFEDFLHLMTHTVDENDTKEDIRKVFALYDDDKTGYVSIQNLRRVAHDIQADISENDLLGMFEKADKDKDGYVSAYEFYSIITRGVKWGYKFQEWSS